MLQLNLHLTASAAVRGLPFPYVGAVLVHCSQKLGKGEYLTTVYIRMGSWTRTHQQSTFGVRVSWQLDVITFNDKYMLFEYPQENYF